VEDAISASGYEDLGDAEAMDIDAYLSGSPSAWAGL
jgi:hypothetical protein